MKQTLVPSYLKLKFVIISSYFTIANMGKEEYLRSIFGKGAIRIETIAIGDRDNIAGRFLWKDKGKLADRVTYVNNQVFFVVTDTDIMGHFKEPGPSTLPAYRMVELMALAGGGKDAKIVSVRSAKFKKIVKPGDHLAAESFSDGHAIITRDSQVVASAYFERAKHGLKPHELGMVLELASQTIVANIGQTLPKEKGLMYPLLTGFNTLSVYSEGVGQKPVVGFIFPVSNDINCRNIYCSDQRRFVFSGSADILKNGLPFASIEGVRFQFATSDAIKIFHSLQQ